MRRTLSLTLLTITIAISHHSLGTEGLPAPISEELTIKELNTSFSKYDGVVVPTKVTQFCTIKQIDKNKYESECRFFTTPSEIIDYPVFFSEAGREYCAGFSKEAYSQTSEIIYILVHANDRIRIGNQEYRFEIVGSNYDKKSGEYGWDHTSKKKRDFSPSNNMFMSFEDILANCLRLDGYVIKTEVSHARLLKQVTSGKHTLYCHFSEGGTTYASEWISFPSEGLDVANELNVKSHSDSPTDLYIKVGAEGQLEAIGTRYKKSKKTYSW